MGLHLSFEEYEAIKRNLEHQERRRALPCVPAKPSGVTLAEAEDTREMTRQNYYAQLEGLGYGPDGLALPRDDKPKRSKYGNHRVEVDGMRFDSRHEAEVYQQLMLRVRVGELKNVLRQVPFDLPGGIRYFADFVTITPDNRIEGVYDAKSPATQKNRVYINKKKQMKACLGFDIQEV